MNEPNEEPLPGAEPFADLVEGDEISIGGVRLIFRFAYGPGSILTG